MDKSKTPQHSSCGDPVDNSLTVAQAQERIRAVVTPLVEHEQVAIRSALGRVLAHDCISGIDVPGHTNAAMDGYALGGGDLPVGEPRDYRVVATVMAGQTAGSRCEPGQCVRIMTGAPLPPGTDTVVMQEQVKVLEDGQVRMDPGHRAGQNVRQAGEDIAAGMPVFTAGRRLTAADIGVLASLGFAELTVRRRPRVAFFSTGDELRSIGDSLGEGEIYDSNRYTLFSMLTEAGVEIFDMGVVRDDRDALRNAFRQASDMADVSDHIGGCFGGWS